MIRNYFKLLRVFTLLIFTQFIAFSQEDTVVVKDFTIPLTDIPESAEKIENYLKLKVAEMIAEPVVFESTKVIDSLLLIKNELSIVTNNISESHLPLEFYQNISFKWKKLDKSLEVPKLDLQEYSTSLNTIFTKLSRENKKWKVTQEELIETSLMPNIVENIKLIRIKIDSVTTVLTDSLSTALNLQSIISNVSFEINTSITSLKSKRQDNIFALLDKKSGALWEVSDKNTETDSTKELGAKTLFHYLVKDSKDYLKGQSKVLIKLFIYSLIVLWVFYWLKGKSANLESEKDKESFKFVFTSLFASVFIYFLILIHWYLPGMPYIIRNTYSILVYIPFLVVAFKITNKKLRWGVVYLFGLFTLLKFISFYKTIFFSGINPQIETLFTSAAMILYMYWIFINRKFILSVYSTDGFWIRFTTKLSPIFLILNVISIIAGVFGYIGLSTVISYGTLVSFIAAYVLQTFIYNANGFIHLFFRTKFAQNSIIIKANTEKVQNFFEKVLFIGTVFLWVKYTLSNLLLYTIIEDWSNGLREIGYIFGESEITLGGISNFFIIIIVFWFLSNFIKMLIRDEIMSRLHLPRGIPMAVSTIVQYVIVVIGIAMAMSSIGFNMENLGILAGALGVGIGFGLQNIVGNFISGLILIFERPITVGDVIIVDNVEGTVTKIGIRSSTIMLYNHSEVIVPNQDLISKQVTNLTLSNEIRRQDLVIHTNLNADPNKVLELMEIAAYEVGDVMKYPVIQTSYRGIVDQSHEFILYYRVSTNFMKAQSEVALSVITKLKEAEIEMYIPQKMVLESKEEPEG